MTIPDFRPLHIAPSAFILLCAIQSISPADAETPSLHSSNATQETEIIDIISNARGENLRLLVKLKHQPRIAATQITNQGFTLSVNGLLLHQTKIDPPNNAYVTGVEITSKIDSQSSNLSFSTSKLTEIRTEIFKNAILITAKLADPALLIPQLMHQQPHYLKSMQAEPKPSTPQKQNNESSFREIFRLTASLCMQAEKLVAEDAWNLEALADQALCMTTDGKLDKAKILVDQIESFTPNNWKTALAHGEILRLQGEVSQSKIKFSYAQQYANNPETKNAIAIWSSRH